ncbi:LPXTG cell wall anchor domain-containing protein [Lentisphaerota bacterium WC36G]|nr:LPXTG cell wall anchor domain-containing protein [Lentisphaerae bacterium WC36]
MMLGAFEIPLIIIFGIFIAFCGVFLVRKKKNREQAGE